ncbi:hypothetical protein TWF703_008966 [Orbilia oligospora]|uniref:Zn(2)-C6 fungal-type domain-containing protein n=1 Tax=Orbilia oligospora TaxID=2813651 RepID=A0A7C8JW36_ORBOL|nr:hypothetical protein TWF703_008966 [Orbilia oligospora]
MSFPSLTPNLNNGDDGLKIWSCTNCRRRKVRCDRKDPCIHCTKNNVECTFPIAGRVPRRNIRGVSKPHKIAPKHQELLSRLRSLEDMVSQLGSQIEYAAIDISTNNDGLDSLSIPEDLVRIETPLAPSRSLSDKTHSNTPQESDNMILENNGNLIVGDRFWTIFCGEVHINARSSISNCYFHKFRLTSLKVERIFEAARGPEPYSFEIHNDSNIESSSGSRSHINYYNFLLRQADAAAKYDLIHPHPSQLLLLWQTYVDDIDPFIKILHIPSMTRLIRDLRGQYYSLKPATEALIFSISFAAISISAENDISQHFSTSKEELLSRYRLYTEQAFEKAGIITSDNIESVQALAIYIYTLRSNEEHKFIWALSGALLRIALRLNLHSDVKPLTGVNALETENRRRLWWQICLTDSTSHSGIAGLSKFQISEDTFDTPMPFNIDDANIRSSILEIQNTTPGRTDLTIFLIRCEIWRLSRRLQVLLSVRKDTRGTSEDPIEFFKDAQTQITETYVKHLRPDIPLDNFVMTMAQLFFSKVELRLLEILPPDNQKVAPNTQFLVQNRFFTLALSTLNDTYSLQHEPSWKPWRWHIRDQTQPYHALSIILNTICRQPWDSKFEQALTSAIRSIDAVPEGTPQHRHFTNLLTAAQSRKGSYVTQNVANSEITNQSDQGSSMPLPPPDEFLPALYSNDFDFTMLSDTRASTSTNIEAWDDMVNLFDPWEFGDIGGM